MLCVVCKNVISVDTKESEIRSSLGFPTTPNRCYRCRLHERYSLSSTYKFQKVKCYFCKKEIVTGSALVGLRPIACEECYASKVLDVYN